MCNRGKNIRENGYCNVCDEVNQDVHKTQEFQKKKNIKEVHVDLESMIRMHEKLLKGEKVEQKEVSSLLLAGIIKILNQHDLINTLEERVEAIKHENITSKLRLESLESWMVKQGEAIKLLDKKLEVEVKGIKDQVTENVSTSSQNTSQDFQRSTIKCKECGKTFAKNCQLEDHLEEHSNVERFNCDICNKEFYLKWRLQKHLEVHTETVKICKFFKNKQVCPFERIGCMFGHTDMANQSSIKNVEDVSEESDMDEESEDIFVPDGNRCHLCQIRLNNRDDLFDHVQRDHEEYYNGMMEVAANLNTSLL